MKIPLATKSIGTDPLTGLEQRVSIYQFTADSNAEVISVAYVVEMLSPTGVIVATSDVKSFIRSNKEEEKDGDGNVVVPALMQFDALRNSEIGQGIVAMLVNDLNSYPNL